jgi:two-component system nitrogen regulation response regulator NtrX
VETARLALPAAAAGTSAEAAGANGPLAERVEGFERATILAELKRQNHHMTNTAKALGLERSHLYKKCEHLGIDLRSARKIE